MLRSSSKGKCVLLFLRVLAALAAIHLPIAQEAAESLQSHRLHSTTNDKRAFQRYFATSAVPSPIFQVDRVRTERVGAVFSEL